ncbi:MAG: hypothetical protein DHS20C11_20010 [Lysobacteraceae bacterium]|nr:MAG: hypothetical protein DHS20C11_20010 [Xanthomonadaceae bacterium]
MITRRFAAIVFATLFLSQPVQSGVTVTVNGNTLVADISLANGIGADLTLEFESAIGLTASSVGISADLISRLDTSLLTRLPDGLVSVPGVFPLLITIEPPSDQALSFSGPVTIDLHTHNLVYTNHSPYRLMKAPLGGDFYDFTQSLGAGSVRSRGRTGGFSQFLIAVDLRDYATVVDDKYADLSAWVTDPAIPKTLVSQLQAKVSASEAARDAGNYIAASDRISELISLVESNAGSSIPNVWRSARDLNNVAGELVGRAASLKFSLMLEHTAP